MKKRVLVMQSPFLRLIGLRNNRLSIAATHDAALLAGSGAYACIYNADAVRKEMGRIGWAGYCKASRQLAGMLTGPVWDEFVGELTDILQEFNPEAIVCEAGDWAVAAKDQNDISADLAVGALLRRIAPGVQTLVVGFSPTMEPDRYATVFDAVIQGVPGRALAEVINRRTTGMVSGVGVGPYLDLMPRLDTIGAGRVDSSRVITEIGCHYGLCTFCPNGLMHGAGAAKKDLNTIGRDVLTRNEKLINIVSNDFGHDLCQRPEMASVLSATGKQFVVDVRAEIARTNQGIELLKDANVRTLKIGVEHLSPLLAEWSKGQTAESVKADLAELHRAGFDILGYLLLGGPGDRPEWMRETLRQAREIDYVAWLPNFYSDPRYADCHNHHFSVPNAQRRGVPADVITEAISLASRVPRQNAQRTRRGGPSANSAGHLCAKAA